MKKRIAWGLSFILVMLMLAACGKTDPKTADYNGRTYDELEQELFLNVNMVAGISQVLPMQGLTVEDLSKEDIRELFITNYQVTEAQLDSVAQWNSISSEFGTCEEFEEDSFEIEKSGKTLTTNLKLIFKKDNGKERLIDFQVVYDSYSMEVTGITIEPEYSLGEKMSKAGLNTVISMSIVFMVLILISLIIYAFKIFPYLEQKKKAKTAESKGAQTPPPVFSMPVASAAEKPKQPEADDTELAAVIAAAIAASEGASTGGFVVRSIKRR